MRTHLLLLIIAGALAVSACTQPASPSQPAPVVPQQVAPSEPIIVQPGQPDAAAPAPSDAAAPPVREFTVTAHQFAFDPATITVDAGDTVILHVTSTDVTHGISIPEFGVSETLPPGEEKTVQFVADKKGTYSFFCNVYCGQGHRDMKGTLVVQ